MEIAVRSPKTGRSVTFEKDLGADLMSAAELFGEDAVYNLYIGQAVIRCQAAARLTLDKPDNTEEQAVEAGQAYTPGVIRRAERGPVGAKKKAQALIASVGKGELTKADLISILEQLKAAAEAAS